MTEQTCQAITFSYFRMFPAHQQCPELWGRGPVNREPEVRVITPGELVVDHTARGSRPVTEVTIAVPCSSEGQVEQAIIEEYNRLADDQFRKERPGVEID